jgi:dUTP pyrophosphatase
MKKLGVYLAYPIDQDNRGDRGLKYAVMSSPAVAWAYFPGDAFRVSTDPADITPAVTHINREALRQADVVVAALPAGVATIGVPMEIEAALSVNKPVVLVSDAPSWALETGNPRMHRATLESVSEVLSEVSVTHTESQGIPAVIEEGAEMPRRAYSDDAGYDLVVSEDATIEPGRFMDIHCGVSVQLPGDSWGLITGRSSTLRNRGLMVVQGVIDAGYRGELFAGVWNLTDQAVRVSKGERLAQLILLHNRTLGTELVQVDQLDPSPRGTKGFGSSGN